VDEVRSSALVILFSFVVLAVILSWLYFRRFQVTRPPIGVFNLRDIAFMIGGIIVVPYLYLLLPLWLVGGLLLLGTLSVLYLLWEPVLRYRPLVWAASLLMVGGDIWAADLFGTTGNGFFVVNNIVLLATAVGLTNLWAQSGMRARDIAILGGFLMFYDFTATLLLPLMGEMMTRLAGLPFSPSLAWAVEEGGAWVGVGLGDLLVACVFPLVMRKAFGKVAGIVAMWLALGAIAAIMVLPVAALSPAMTMLGPLMVLQYIYWMHRRGGDPASAKRGYGERTTRQYLLAEPLLSSAASHGSVRTRDTDR
jgi:hypothetical protein